VTGKKLKAIRVNLGMTQPQLAARMGIARNTVNRMEFGGQSITLAMEILIYFVAREADLEIPDPRAGRGAASPKQAKGAGAADPEGKGRRRSRKNTLRRGRR